MLVVCIYIPYYPRIRLGVRLISAYSLIDYYNLGSRVLFSYPIDVFGISSSYNRTSSIST
jgi:hypothetical protein